MQTKFRMILGAMSEVIGSLISELDAPQDAEKRLSQWQQLNEKVGDFVDSFGDNKPHEIVFAENELRKKAAEAAQLAAEAERQAKQHAEAVKLAEAAAVAAEAWAQLGLSDKEFLRLCELGSRSDQKSCYAKLSRTVETNGLDLPVVEQQFKGLFAEFEVVWCKITIKTDAMFGNRLVIEAIFKTKFEMVEARQATIQESFQHAVHEQCQAALDSVLSRLQEALEREDFGALKDIHVELSDVQHSWALAELVGGQEERHEKLKEIGQFIADMEQEQRQFAMRAKIALHGPNFSSNSAPRTLHRVARPELSPAEKAKRYHDLMARRTERLENAPQGVTGNKPAPGKGKPSKRASSDPHRNGK